jgi:hypothetical protein
MGPSELSQIALAIVGAFIAVFAHRLSHRQRIDTWVRTFTDMHRLFWQDDDFGKVRAWIANDQCYFELEKILCLRLLKDGRSTVSPQGYSSLEKLDKFLNFLLAAHDTTDHISEGERFWDELYFQFWVDEIVRANRHYLWIYWQDYYIEYANLIPPKVPQHKFEEFKFACQRKREELPSSIT